MAETLEETLAEVQDRQLDLISRHGMPKLGRWIYCKYCFKNVLPQLDFDGGLVRCAKCGYGLAPLDRVIECGSCQRWEEELLEVYKAFNLRRQEEKHV